MSNITQFSADFTQLTLSKKTKVVLEIPEGTSFTKLAEIAQHRGERIVVQFGNPQMAMDFGPNNGSRPGLVATIDGSGSVERVIREQGGEDADNEEPAENVLVQEEEGEQQEVDFEDPNHDPEPEEDENQDTDPAEDPSADAEQTDEEQEADVDQEELEAYILSERPQFDDIPFDLPEMLRRRREEGEKWMDLAKEAGIPSTKLQQFWNVYKKRVKKQILEVKGAA